MALLIRKGAFISPNLCKKYSFWHSMYQFGRVEIGSRFISVNYKTNILTLIIFRRNIRQNVQVQFYIEFIITFPRNCHHSYQEIVTDDWFVVSEKYVIHPLNVERTRPTGTLAWDFDDVASCFCTIVLVRLWEISSIPS